MEKAEEHDPGPLADKAEEQTDELGQRNEALEERVMEVRRDWERKRSDPSVPGAVPDDRGEADAEAEGESPAKEAPPEDAGDQGSGHTGDSEHS
jgi:hypothetical protein